MVHEVPKEKVPSRTKAFYNCLINLFVNILQDEVLDYFDNVDDRRHESRGGSSYRHYTGM